jgi:hypothetical protein
LNKNLPLLYPKGLALWHFSLGGSLLRLVRHSGLGLCLRGDLDAPEQRDLSEL